MRAGEVGAIVREHIDLAECLALKAASRSKSGIDLDDVLSAAMAGLFSAAIRFDAGRGVPFRAFAATGIRFHIQNAVRSHTRRTRQLWKFERAADDLERLLGRRPTDDEVKERLGWRDSALRKARWSAASLVSLESPEALAAPSPAPTPIEAIEAKERNAELRRAMSLLREHERQVIELAFFHDLPDSEIASRVGFHPHSTMRIRHRAIEKLRSALGLSHQAPISSVRGRVDPAALKSLRRKHGLSQAELADQCGVTIATVSLWERGMHAPHVRHAKSLSRALGVPITDLMAA